MTVRRAAVVVALVAIVTAFGTPIAEFVIWPRLIDLAQIGQTVANIRADQGLYLALSFAYLAGFAGDIVISWALYYLFRPVSPSLAALAAILRGVQAIISIGAALNLFTLYRLLGAPAMTALGPDQLNSQAFVLLSSFGYQWGFALVIFGLHLCLLGYLAYRSGYIPRLVGIALAVAGSGYVLFELRPYLYPNAPLGFLYATFTGELVFIVWLVVWGRRLPDPVSASAEP